MVASARPPSGWFPDPVGRYRLRFWSGTTWTEHVVADGKQFVDPLGAPPTAPVPPPRTATPVIATPPAHGDTAEHKSGWLERHRQKREASRAQAQANAAARDELEKTAIDAALGDPVATRALQSLIDQSRKLYSDKEFDEKSWVVLTKAIRVALADDVLTEDESEHLQHLGSIFGITPLFDRVAGRDPDLIEELVVAEINDGRLPIEEHSSLLVKTGEIVHYSCQVALMKEVARREFRGGSQGVSIRVAKGSPTGSAESAGTVSSSVPS